ncbi:hypothetical protein AD998_08500 [bacterium 336/3]|nr:hypothetical protein AD998_08500 [bacterium 336/3]
MYSLDAKHKQNTASVGATAQEKKPVMITNNADLQVENALQQQNKQVTPTSTTTNGRLPKKTIEQGKEKEYFEKYEQIAQNQLDKWYAKKTVAEDLKLKGSYFANAAKKIYEKFGDLNYVVPAEVALAQAYLEGGVYRHERGGSGNIFHMGATDSGDNKTAKGIKTVEDGFDVYYLGMANLWLGGKQSGSDIIKKNGMIRHDTKGVFASNPHYEAMIRSQVGEIHRNITLKGSVGNGGKNFPEDVKKVGSMLAKLGYLKNNEIENVEKVTQAVLKFQTTELAPVTEQWYKNRIAIIEKAGKKAPAATKQSLADIEIQRKRMTDGLVGKSGTTINVLFFMAELGGQIPDIMSKHLTNTPQSQTTTTTTATPATTSSAIKPKTTAQATSTIQNKRGIVQPGENLETLSNKYGISAADLKTANQESLKEKGGVEYFNAGAELSMPEILTSPIVKSTSGFSVGASSSTYQEEMINFVDDVALIQEKLYSVGLLSEADYQKEKPVKKTQPEIEVILPQAQESHEETQDNQEEQTNLSPTSTPQEALENITQPYTHQTTEFERKMLLVYGKVPSNPNDKVSSKDIPNTIKAINIFQAEVNRKGVDGRIDPQGSTLKKLMASTSESVSIARREYALSQQRKAEEAKRREQQAQQKKQQEQEKPKPKVEAKKTPVSPSVWSQLQKHGLETYDYLFENLSPARQYETLKGLLTSYFSSKPQAKPKSQTKPETKPKPKAETSNAIKPKSGTPDFSLAGLKAIMREKNYEFYEEEGKLNLIAVRMDDKFDNQFSDKLFAIQKTKSGSVFLEVPWTTFASVHGSGGVKDPLDGKENGTGVAGVATIVEGQYKDVYTFSSNKRFGQHLRQSKDMQYYRDNDKDLELDRGKIYTGNYGTHLHKMSKVGVERNDLGTGKSPWSMGCNGTSEPQFRKLIPLFEAHGKYKHGNISYTILHQKDFVK